MSNPFTLSFGKEPQEYIKRINEYDEIIETFNSNNPMTNLFIITGVRGAGKTVLLSSLYKYFDNNDDYIAIDINTTVNMLEDFSAKLYDKTPKKIKSLKAEFSFSFHGLTISLKGEEPVSSVSLLLEKMLNKIKKTGKKVVVTVDDIDTGDYMKAFVKEFQSLYRKELPIYLIATGLYNVVDTLEKQEGLTFLQRGQKRYLAPLNRRYIISSYKEIFNIDDKLACSLADLTKGYAFAFQTLGYLFYESDNREINATLLKEYDYYLEEYVYRRLYSELSEKEKNILKHISLSKLESNKELVEAGVVTNQEISNYKEKLFKRGICDIKERGKITIILPRFKEYIVYRTSEENSY